MSPIMRYAWFSYFKNEWEHPIALWRAGLYNIICIYIYNDFSIIISNSYLSLIDIFFIRAVAVLAFQYFEDS